MKVLQIKESRLKLFGCSSKLVAMCNVLQSVKTKETNPTRPGSPTPCKQALKRQTPYRYTLSLWRNCRICLPNILFPVFMFAFIFHCRSFFSLCSPCYFTLACLWCGRTVSRSLARCTVT